MKENYVIKTGDIIRVEEAFAVNNQLYFHTNVDENGIYTAHALNGSIASGYPLDTIEYVRTEGRWWKVVNTYCEMEDVERNDGEVTYDLEELPPCSNCFLENEYKNLLG